MEFTRGEKIGGIILLISVAILIGILIYMALPTDDGSNTYNMYYLYDGDVGIEVVD